jgi:hypothetical protein
MKVTLEITPEEMKVLEAGRFQECLWSDVSDERDGGLGVLYEVFEGSREVGVPIAEFSHADDSALAEVMHDIFKRMFEAEEKELRRLAGRV